MSENGIKAKQKRRFQTTTDSRHDMPIAENILNRQFDIQEPNKVWVNDMTCIPTEEGWLYLAGTMDLGSKTIAGWSMSESMDRKIVIDSLTMAYERRQPGAGLIHHSDRGSQYASYDYQSLVESYKMVMSMSRKGNCWDNAPMESFFATLKKELVHHKKYLTREEAKRDIFEYIEIFYNRHRIHSSLGYLSPSEYENQFAVKKVA